MLLPQKLIYGKTYHHWLAIDMENVKAELANKSDERLNEPSLEKLVTHWSSLFFPEELNMTSHLQPSLNEYLSPICLCAHQCSVLNQIPDFTIYDFNIYDNQPGISTSFVAVSDYKVSNIKHAVVESFAYSLLLSCDPITHPCLRIAFPCTKSEVQLHLHFGIPGKVLSIPIITARTKSEIKIAFVLLKYACGILLRNKLSSGYEVHPSKELSLPIPPLGLGRIFKKGDSIFKLYGTEDTCCVELQKLVFPDASLTCLSSDGSIRCLKYKFRMGDHEPKNPKQLICAFKQLKMIHDRQYVHGDVRVVNVIFSGCGKEAWLIDFDFAGKVDMPYPVEYGTEFMERHCDAKPMMPRKKIHDIFAMNCILQDNFPDMPNVCEIYEQNEFNIDLVISALVSYSP